MAKRYEENDVEDWITVHGRRVPIMKGQSKADAVRSVVSKNSDMKEKQIAANKAEGKKLNNEKTSTGTGTSKTLTRDSIIKNGGSVKVGDYKIEIGKTYNKKANDYSGPYGKKTAVYGKGTIKYFNSTEKAIEYVQKANKKGK